MTSPATGTAPTAIPPGSLPPSGPDRQAELSAGFLAVLDQHISDAPKPRSSGRNDGRISRDEDVRRRSPSLDPTAAAMAELVSPGPVKPVMAQAQAIASGQAEPGPAAAAGLTRAQPEGRARGESAGQNEGPKAPSGDQSASRPTTQPAPAQPRGESPARPAKVESAQPAKAGAAAGIQQAQQIGVLPKAPAARSAMAPVSPQAGGLGAARGLAGGTKASETRATVKADRPPPRFKFEPQEEKVAAQFQRGLAAALRQNGGSVTIRLQPEALGDLKIKMSLESGKVGASFEVRTDQARRLLGKSMDSLKSALEARGLEVDRLDVRVADQATPGQAGSIGGADADPGRGGGSGWEHPEPRMARTARMPDDVGAAEPAEQNGPWMGLGTGGALRIRLDALA